MICYNCDHRHVCRFYSVFKNFRGDLSVKTCNEYTNTSAPVQDMPAVKSKPSEETSRAPRSLESLQETDRKLKELEAQERMEEEPKIVFFEGNCKECGCEASDLQKCDKCGELFCSEHLTEDIMSGKNVCSVCNS